MVRAIVNTWICRYSTPKVLVTDRGREFCSKLSDELFSKLGVEWRHTLAYHPQTNSAAESFNRELIKIMTTMLDVPDDPEWEARLAPADSDACVQHGRAQGHQLVPVFSHLLEGSCHAILSVR